MKTTYLNSFKARNYFAVLALTLLLVNAQKSEASHAAGADITYTWLGGLRYLVTCTFYRDCAGIAAPTQISLDIHSNACGAYGATYFLNPIAGTGNEITHPCPNAPTTCTGGGQPGIQKWVYQDTITLPFHCTDWNFNFAVAARNCAITTIVKPNPCNSTNSPGNIYVEAGLNNIADSTTDSPVFSNDPIAFACIGQDYLYNMGVNNSNGDSLVYSFVTPKTDGIGDTVTFLSGYDSAHFVTSSPPPSLDPNTGDLFFHPTAVEVGIVAILVKEYHNGVLVGSVIRDMQIYTVVCTNILPVASGINGTTNYSAYVCAGSTLCFDVLSHDVDTGQVVTMTWNNGISAATFTITGATRPIGHFCWSPTINDVSSTPYTFTVTVRDNACPRNGVQVFSYSITVETADATASSTNVSCHGGHNGTATATPITGSTPFSYLWSPSQSTGQTATGLSVGSYTVLVTSAHGCSVSQSVTITQPSALSVSINNLVNANCNQLGSFSISASGGSGGYTYFTNTIPSQTTSNVTNVAPGTYTITVRDAHGCRASATASITSSSLAATATTQDVTCFGGSNGSATISVTGATGTLTYIWSPNISTTNSASGLTTGTYSVSISDGTCFTQVGFIINFLHPLPTVSLGPDSTLCSGNTVTLNPGQFSAYLWSNGSTSQTLNVDTSGSYNVMVTDVYGCQNSASVNITFHSCGGGGTCTFTQGFWGNRGGLACDSFAKPQLIDNLLSPPLVIGAGARTITFSVGDGSCIIQKLPANTTPKVLPVGNVTCATATGPSYLTRVGRFNNVLLGQTLTLGLNMRFSSSLDSLKLSSTITTYATSGPCGTGNSLSNSQTNFSIPNSVINYLGPNATVWDLFVLANNALGTVYIPHGNHPTLSDINQAEDAINNAFDNCRSSNSPRLEAARKGLNVLVYPNPANDELNVTISGVENETAVQIQLSDILGHTVSAQSAKVIYDYTGNVNLTNLSNGIYILKVQYGNELKTVKVVKE